MSELQSDISYFMSWYDKYGKSYPNFQSAMQDFMKNAYYPQSTGPVLQQKPEIAKVNALWRGDSADYAYADLAKLKGK